MTTEVIGHLPCSECSSTQALKSDERKHTLKCDECGLLTYYQTQAAKTHIEQRLETGESPASNNTVTLALPQSSDQLRRYILSIERFNSGELALVPVEYKDTDMPVQKAKTTGWFSSLDDMF